MPKPEDLAQLNRHVLLTKLASLGVLLFGLIGFILYFGPPLVGVPSEYWEITRKRLSGC
jgi:hypothetical protein